MLETKVTPYVVPTESHYDNSSVRKCIIAQLRNGTESHNTDTSKISAISIWLFFFFCLCQVKNKNNNDNRASFQPLKYLFSHKVLFVVIFLFGQIITVCVIKDFLIQTHDPIFFSHQTEVLFFSASFQFYPLERTLRLLLPLLKYQLNVSYLSYLNFTFFSSVSPFC